jgi:hypothetical protein
LENLDLTWAAAARASGLSERTLRALDKGGKHKIETAFQFEQAFWGTRLYSSEFYNASLYNYSHENDELFEQITDDAGHSRSAAYACALPNSATISDIERSALCSLNESWSSIRDDVDKSQRKLAFENYLFWLKHEDSRRDPKATSRDTFRDGLASKFRFTVHDSLYPLSKAQVKYIEKLDKAIDQFVKVVREGQGKFSSSLISEAQKDGTYSARKELGATLAILKRVNINVLSCVMNNDNAVMVLGDEEYEEDFVDPSPSDFDHGGEYYGQEGYIVHYIARLNHIVLAPSSILRYAVPNLAALDFQTQPMWSWKGNYESGEIRDPVDGFSGVDSRSDLLKESNKVIALISRDSQKPSNAESDKTKKD